MLKVISYTNKIRSKHQTLQRASKNKNKSALKAEFKEINKTLFLIKCHFFLNLKNLSVKELPYDKMVLK